MEYLHSFTVIVSLCSWVHQTQKNEDFQSISETEVLLFAPDTCSQLSSGLRGEIDLCPNLGSGGVEIRPPSEHTCLPTTASPPLTLVELSCLTPPDPDPQVSSRILCVRPL